MRFPKPLAATIALSMIATPVFAQSAAPLSLAPAGAQLEQESGLRGDDYFIPAIAIFAVLLAAILYTSNHGSDIDNPHSP
jgi:hypothetical protein